MSDSFFPGTIKAKANKTGISGNQTVYLVYHAPEKPVIDKETIALASSSDVVILFVGTDIKTANEEADRLTLTLPGNQYGLKF